MTVRSLDARGVTERIKRRVFAGAVRHAIPSEQIRNQESQSGHEHRLRLKFSSEQPSLYARNQAPSGSGVERSALKRSWQSPTALQAGRCGGESVSTRFRCPHCGPSRGRRIAVACDRCKAHRGAHPRRTRLAAAWWRCPPAQSRQRTRTLCHDRRGAPFDRAYRPATYHSSCGNRAHPSWSSFLASLLLRAVSRERW
jgi:hypothetical protein